jgi:hypothetical protein
MSTLSPHECRHTIPGEEIAEKVVRLIDLLVTAGEDPAGLFEDDFVQVVSRQAMWDRVGRAHDLGLNLGSPRMEQTEQGDVHLVFAFERKVDAFAFRTAIL